jgi:excisionase family DNA binding protein
MMKALLVDTHTACSMLAIGKTKLFEMLRENKLIRIKAGRKTLVTLASVEAFAQERDAQSRSATSHKLEPSSESAA